MFWSVGAAMVVALVLILLFISPIAKFLIEKYDEKYTGRKITLDWAYVNPFTGFIHLSNVKISEAKKDTLSFGPRAQRRFRRLEIVFKNIRHYRAHVGPSPRNDRAAETRIQF